MNILLALFFVLSSPEIETELVSGDTVYVEEATIDLITRQPTMELKGSITTDRSQLEVTVTRSAIGLSDQLCVSSCMNGNGEETQLFTFPVTANQVNGWYAHFIPSTAGENTLTYVFSDGEERFTLTAVFRYTPTGIEELKDNQKAKGEGRKTIRNGHVFIEHNNHQYSILGL